MSSGHTYFPVGALRYYTYNPRTYVAANPAPRSSDVVKSERALSFHHVTRSHRSGDVVESEQRTQIPPHHPIASPGYYPFSATLFRYSLWRLLLRYTLSRQGVEPCSHTWGCAALTTAPPVIAYVCVTCLPGKRDIPGVFDSQQSAALKVLFLIRLNGHPLGGGPHVSILFFFFRQF